MVWILLRLVLLLHVTIIGIQARECPFYGCTMLSRDVLRDDSLRQILSSLRRGGRTSGSSSSSTSSGLDQDDTSCGNDSHATLTMIGYKGGKEENQINQDRAFVINPFMTNYHLSGVFDGHGTNGEIVAEYSLHEFPKRLAQKLHHVVDTLHHQDSIIRILKDTFLDIDRDARSVSRGKGGCTASIVLRIGDSLYIANAGDSISIVATCSHIRDHGQNNHDNKDTRHDDDESPTRAQVHFVTREDKPHLEEERSRIEAMGGRVWIPSDLTQESSRVLFVDPNTGYQTGLAMSRSIGDWDMVGVIAEPVVTVLSISSLLGPSKEHKDNDESCTADDVKSNTHLFVVSATDGLMDYVDSQTLAESFATAFCEQSLHPLCVAEDLVYAAAKGWNSDMAGEYRDDIAMAASMLI
jgi:serine/threonine protein phosphatase PrpC